jgi:hypothetical protein
VTRPEESTAVPETTEMIGDYRVHPAANLLPDPTPEEYERLKADIKEHGLLEPILLVGAVARYGLMHVEDEQAVSILDGRSRARACHELGIKVSTEWDDGTNPVGTVLSLNAARRHLAGDQIIALYLKANAAKLEAEKQEAKVAQQTGLKKGSTRPVSTTVKPTGKMAEKIAKAVGKSKSAVERVQRVQKVAPERMADVAAGRASAGEVLKESKPKPTGKAPVNKTDLWEGIVRYETPEERHDVVEWLDKAFEFIQCGNVRLEDLNHREDLGYYLADCPQEFKFLLEDSAFSDFPTALAAIEMGAMCLTPAHIKALTQWHDRIGAILQKRAEVEGAPGDPAEPGS